MVACYQKGHVVDFATNSSGWEVTNKTGSFEGKHVASERKKPWYKFDLDFAVNIDVDIKKSSKRALGMFSEMDEAFDVKVCGIWVRVLQG